MRNAVALVLCLIDCLYVYSQSSEDSFWNKFSTISFPYVVTEDTFDILHCDVDENQTDISVCEFEKYLKNSDVRYAEIVGFGYHPLLAVGKYDLDERRMVALHYVNRHLFLTIYDKVNKRAIRSLPISFMDCGICVLARIMDSRTIIVDYYSLLLNDKKYLKSVNVVIDSDGKFRIL